MSRKLEVILCNSNLANCGEEWKPPGDTSDFESTALQLLQSDPAYKIRRESCQAYCGDRGSPDICRRKPFCIVDDQLFIADDYRLLCQKIRDYAKNRRKIKP